MGYGVGLILTLVIVMSACGGSEEVMPTPTATPLPTPTETTANGGSNFSLTNAPDWPIESRILRSDVVARVKLHSVAHVVERVPKAPEYNGKDYYVAALEFTFDVLEYLKGSGGNRIKAIADDYDEWFATEAKAIANGPDLLSTRITRWDDREAIIFVSKHDIFASMKQADRYWLSYARDGGRELYTVANYSWRAWLPDAATPVPASEGTSGQTSSGGQTFLLEEPPGSSSGGSGSGSSQSSPATVTLSALKTLIARLDSEVKAGVASKEYVLKYNLGDFKYTEEDYAWCLSVKYYDAHHAKRYVGSDGKHVRSYSEDINMTSGSPAGTDVYQPEFIKSLGANLDSTGYELVDWLSGRDANLFTAGFPTLVETARPLPAGEYRFFYHAFSFNQAICDAPTKAEKERAEYIITVTAPTGTVHEAFFDPVGIGSAVGFDSSNGVLKPTGFTVEGAPASIMGLKWESGEVALNLSPYVSLEGRTLDFIGMEGETSLSLAFNDAISDSEVGTFTWRVDEQPWESGDEVMIRIW